MATLSAPTLERLIKETRILLNQQNPDNSFWSDPELTIYLNDGVRQYFTEVAERAEGQFDTVTDLDIVANTETVALPTDCHEVKALYKKRPDGTYDPLPFKQSLTESYSTLGGTDGNLYAPSCYFRGNNLVFRPVPNFSETAGLKLEYTAFPETMIVGGDSLGTRVSPVFKELIVMYAVYKAKVKEDLVNNSNTSAKAESMLSACYLKFKESVGLRSKYPQYTKPFQP